MEMASVSSSTENPTSIFDFIRNKKVQYRLTVLDPASLAFIVKHVYAIII